MKTLSFLLALLLVSAIAVAQQPVTIRVCTYNVLNYGKPSSEQSEPLSHVISAVAPDLFVVHQLAGVTGSYTAFGNDAQHFNDSINRMPNLAVDSATAQALHDASDHLPVYLDLVFTTQTSEIEERRNVPTEMNLSRVEKP
jgi:hypothetical protein